VLTLENFKTSLSLPHPPGNLSNYLKAMWFDGKNDWERAHDIAQNIDDKNGSLIHAYLHRKEGSDWNADYWYRRSGRDHHRPTLEAEWAALVEALVGGMRKP